MSGKVQDFSENVLLLKHYIVGIQKSTAHCYRGDGEEVNPRNCDQTSQPKTGISSCNTQPCQPRYNYIHKRIIKMITSLGS